MQSVSSYSSQSACLSPPHLNLQANPLPEKPNHQQKHFHITPSTHPAAAAALPKAHVGDVPHIARKQMSFKLLLSAFALAAPSCSSAAALAVPFRWRVRI